MQQEDLIETPLTTGMRLFLVVLAGVPLILVLDFHRLLWPLRPASLFPALLALPAIALSGIILASALGGQGIRWRINDDQLTIETSRWRRRHSRSLRYGELREARLEENPWSDGPPSFTFSVTLNSGEVLAGPSLRDAPEAQRILRRLQALISAAQPGRASEETLD